MAVLNSLDKLLEHIKEVQLDVISLSNDSLLKMSNFIEENNIEVDENILTALQYQDIITQQLTATIKAIDSVKVDIKRFSHTYDSDENLQKKLNTTLADAKEKKDRFSGKTTQNDVDTDEIEFF